MRQGCPLLLLLFNIVLQVLATVIRLEEIKGIQIGKEEVKLIIFRQQVIVHRNSISCIKKLLDLINEFCKVAGCKVNIQKSMVYLHTNNELLERETRKTISFTIATKK